MLEIHDLNVFYGGIHPLRGVSLKVEAGSIVTLVGSNGAGKSTTLRTISGLGRPKSGSITLLGEEITRAPVDGVVKRGSGHGARGKEDLPNLTVWENLRIGAYNRSDIGEISKDIEWVYSLFPRLVRQVSDFTPGDSFAVADVQGARLSASICYEAIFPDLLRQFSARGSELLVNVTNDAWYGTTSAPHQHLAMAAFRAIENRRYLVRAANTGITAVVGPRGTRAAGRPPCADAANHRTAAPARPCRGRAARSHRGAAGRHGCRSAELHGLPARLGRAQEGRGRSHLHRRVRARR